MYYEHKGYKNKKTSFFDAVFHKVINTFFIETDIEKFDIELRYVDILRGEDFVNDLLDLYLEKYPELSKFELGTLISILYTDFIEQVKNGTISHATAAKSLLSGKRTYLDSNKSRPTRKELHQVSPNTLIFEDIEEYDDDELDRDVSVNDMVFLEITSNKRLNNRCKVLLYDIESHLAGEEIRVQDVIVLRYINFIERIRQGGNNPKMMKAILKNFINL